MAFTADFVCTSFKVDLLFARHKFQLSGGDAMTLALYDNTPTFNAATTAYTTSGEVVGTGYTAKGKALTRIDPTFSGTTAYTDFDDVTWPTSTITSYGALLYNDTLTTPVADASIAVLNFGGAKTSVAGDFTVQFPVAAAGSAIIRIA